MHFEEFSHGHSLIHRLDPRVKAASAALFSIVVALADRPAVLWAALGISIGLVLLAGLHRPRVLSRLAIVNGFVLFLWFFLPFTHPGTAAFTLGPLTASKEGLALAGAVTLKSNAIILAVMALLATNTVFTLIHALRHLYLPDKLVHLFFFTFRYLQVIHEEYLRLRAAMRIRCFRPRTNLHTYRSLAYLLGMLLVRSFDRSERVLRAMRCRGYDGRLWVLDHFHFSARRDLTFLAIMTAFTALLGTLQWTALIR